MKYDSFSGHITIGNNNYVFKCEDYQLILISPNKIEYITNLSSVFAANSSNVKGKRELKDIIINGICLDDCNAYFCVVDYPWIGDCDIRYMIKWFYKIDNKNYSNIPLIKGITFSSNEINKIYSIDSNYEETFGYLKNDTIDYQLVVNKEKPKFIDKFRFKNYSIRIFGDLRLKRTSKNSTLVNLLSVLSLEFSRNNSDLNCIYRLILLQKLVISYLSYRRNVCFDSIESYITDKNAERIYIGHFCLNETLSPEDDYKEIDKTISYDNISCVGKLYELIDKEKIYLTHICENSMNKRIYGPQRMLGIMISFERLFSWIYGDDKIRNKKYNDSVSLIHNYLLEKESDIKKSLPTTKYYKKIVNYVKIKTDEESRINYVIKHEPIINSYIKNLYGKNNISYTKCRICARLNKLRNDLAHGNMNIDFNTNHQLDIQLLEIINYIMVFDYLKLNPSEIIKKINKLFNIKTFML